MTTTFHCHYLMSSLFFPQLSKFHGLSSGSLPCPCLLHHMYLATLQCKLQPTLSASDLHPQRKSLKENTTMWPALTLNSWSLTSTRPWTQLSNPTLPYSMHTPTPPDKQSDLLSSPSTTLNSSRQSRLQFHWKIQMEWELFPKLPSYKLCAPVRMYGALPHLLPLWRSRPHPHLKPAPPLHSPLLISSRKSLQQFFPVVPTAQNFPSLPFQPP